MKKVCLIAAIIFSASVIANAQQKNTFLKLQDPAKSQQLLDSFRTRNNIQLQELKKITKILEQQEQNHTAGKMPCIRPDMSQFTIMPNAANKEMLTRVTPMPNAYRNRSLLQSYPFKSGSTIIKPAERLATP